MDKLIKAKPLTAGIAFMGNEWESQGADKKKHKNNDGQLCFFLDEIVGENE